MPRVRPTILITTHTAPWWAITNTNTTSGGSCPLVHVVAPGEDTCGLVGLSYGVATLGAMLEANPWPACRVLREGQQLCIPDTTGGERNGQVGQATR